MPGDPARRRTAAARHELILHRARLDGRVDVAALAAELDVTTETVRRDLMSLSQQGLVNRVHGGALAAARRLPVPDLSMRLASMSEEKLAIAETALAELPRQGTVIIDAGSTTQRLAERIPDDRELTVVTNSIQIASILVAKRCLNVHTVGGRLNRDTLAEVDAWALHALAGVWADVAFLGVRGLTVERGASVSDQSEAVVKRAFIASAQRIVVLADRSKLGTNQFATFAELGGLDLLVTDAGADPSYVSRLKSAGLAVRHST